MLWKARSGFRILEFLDVLLEWGGVWCSPCPWHVVYSLLFSLLTLFCTWKALSTCKQTAPSVHPSSIHTQHIAASCLPLMCRDGHIELFTIRMMDSRKKLTSTLKCTWAGWTESWGTEYPERVRKGRCRLWRAYYLSFMESSKASGYYWFGRKWLFYCRGENGKTMLDTVTHIS